MPLILGGLLLLILVIGAPVGVAVGLASFASLAAEGVPPAVGGPGCVAGWGAGGLRGGGCVWCVRVGGGGCGGVGVAGCFWFEEAGVRCVCVWRCVCF